MIYVFFTMISLFLASMLFSFASIKLGTKQIVFSIVLFIAAIACSVIIEVGIAMQAKEAKLPVNIRVDLLLTYPLIIFTLLVIVMNSAIRSRMQPEKKLPQEETDSEINPEK